MRGGLDDALDKLARRDELRRRANGETTATPPAVQELVEAIASVVGRNPRLEVTVGVEGAGDPTLLHFYVEQGTVRVTADSSVASRAETGPRHADFDLDADEPFADRPAAHAAPSYDDRDRYDPGTGYDLPDYDVPARPAHAGEDTTADIDAARFRSPFAATPPPPVPVQQTQPPHDRGMPAPLPEPIPLQHVDTSETEQAARRLAAMLRDNPTLLRRDRT